jgi:hypothetical protein
MADLLPELERESANREAAYTEPEWPSIRAVAAASNRQALGLHQEDAVEWSDLRSVALSFRTGHLGPTACDDSRRRVAGAEAGGPSARAIEKR